MGLFGVAMSPRSVGHRPRQDWRALRDVSPTQSDPYLPSSALHGSHRHSRDYTVGKTSSRNCVDQSAQPINATVHAWVVYESVAIS